MMPFWKRTPKPSESPALHEIIREQSKALASLSQQLALLLAERDAQIRLVLESKFQPYVQMMPARETPKVEPDPIEHLADVSEMTEESAETEAVKATTRYNAAEAEFQKQLDAELEDLQKEHEEAHQPA
jgi:hypothetical protein